MRIFITGATGWVGSAVVAQLLAAGHSVTGLARAKDKAQALADSGAQVLHGDLDDLDLLAKAAGEADAVIHTAFNHDFSRFAENARQDQRAIETLGQALIGSDRMLLVTGGVAMISPGRLATEQDPPVSNANFPRRSEHAARALREQGVRASCIRLSPSVHGLGDHGFIPILIAMAREKGVSAFIGDGENRWPGVHRLDAARLYGMVVEQGASEVIYHAVADEGVPFRLLAEVIGRHLGLPVESRPAEHFGWFGNFAGADMPASSESTRRVLGWLPGEIGLLDDVDQAGYYL